MAFTLTKVVNVSDVNKSHKISTSSNFGNVNNYKKTDYNKLSLFQKKAYNRVKELIDFANERWSNSRTRWEHSLELDFPEISFDLFGETTGRSRGFHLILLNDSIIEKNWKEYKEEVIPHMVAHLVVNKLYYLGLIGSKDTITKLHGREWTRVISEFGCETKIKFCDCKEKF